MRTARYAAGLLALALIAVPAAADEFFFSPAGSDSAAGTEAQPFRSLMRARDAARRAAAGGAGGSHTIWIRAGVYAAGWDDTGAGPSGRLSLTAEDSAAPGETIAWRAYRRAGPPEPVLISGGQTVSGWSEDPDPRLPASVRRWKAPVETRDSVPRDAYVNNTRLVRARWPKLRRSPVTHQYLESSFAHVLSSDLWDGRMVQVDTQLPGAAGAYTHSGVLQAIAFNDWTAPRQEIDRVAIGTGSTVITTSQSFGIGIRPSPCNPCPAGDPGCTSASDVYTVNRGDRVYFEGAKDFLTEAGEFYLDPERGEMWVVLDRALTPGRNATVVVALAPTLWDLTGVSGVSIRDLNFAFTQDAGYAYPGGATTGWHPRAAGFAANCHVAHNVSEFPMAGALELRDCARCDIRSCRVAHAGGNGVAIRGGSRDALIGCEVFDIGATAVFAGRRFMNDGHASPCANPPPPTPSGFEILNNYIHDYSLNYHEGSGVLCDIVESTSIRANHVENGGYSGIHVGWGFNKQDPCGAGPYLYAVDISSNILRNQMLLLHDGGAIHLTDGCRKYAAGGNSCSVTRNRIFGIYSDRLNAPQQRRGIMVDQLGPCRQSTFNWTIRENVIHAPLGPGTVAITDLDAGLPNCPLPPGRSRALPHGWNDYNPRFPNWVEQPRGRNPVDWVPNEVYIQNLAAEHRTPEPEWEKVRDAAGPEPEYRVFLYATHEPLVHPPYRPGGGENPPQP